MPRATLCRAHLEEAGIAAIWLLLGERKPRLEGGLFNAVAPFNQSLPWRMSEDPSAPRLWPK